MTTAADTFLKSPAITRSGGTNAGTRRFINLEAPLAATVSAIAEPLSVRQADILDSDRPRSIEQGNRTNSFRRTRDRQNARQAYLH